MCVGVRARELGNKKKKKKEERKKQLVGFVQEPKRKKKKEKRSHLEEKNKLFVFTSVGPTNFDIFTIGRKKKRVYFFIYIFLIWYCCKIFFSCVLLICNFLIKIYHIIKVKC